MELFEILDFAFHFDSHIDIGGSFRASYVTSVENDSRDPAQKAVILVDSADSFHESLKGLVGVLPVNRLGGGGVAKLVTAVSQLVPFHAGEVVAPVLFSLRLLFIWFNEAFLDQTCDQWGGLAARRSVLFRMQVHVAVSEL